MLKIEAWDFFRVLLLTKHLQVPASPFIRVLLSNVGGFKALALFN